MSVPAIRFENFLGLFRHHVSSPEPVTSDHTRQAIKIEERDRGGNLLLTISGTTWNTMGIGYGASRGYSNNPFKADESSSSYVSRKEMQMQDILRQVQAKDEKDIKYSPIDFMLLQEAGWLINQVVTSSTLPEPHKSYLKKVIGQFKDALRAARWNFIFPAPALQIHGFRVILYNTAVLRLSKEPSRGIFPSEHYRSSHSPERCFTGYEVCFQHGITGRDVAITNVHFDPDLTHTSDFSQQVLDYQFEMRSRGILTIIGGDTNHAQNVNQIGLIGARDYATQMGGRDCDGSLRTRRTGTSEFPMEYPKRYDGFFACPSSIDTRITATELRGMYFRKRTELGRVRIFANYLDPKITYAEALQRRAQIGKDVHIHSNGYYYDMAFGWPYIPHRIKLFFVRILKLVATDPEIVTAAGVPKIRYCLEKYAMESSEAIQDFKDLNETYYEALKECDAAKVTDPRVETQQTIEFVKKHEELHREKLEKSSASSFKGLCKMWREGKDDIIEKETEQKKIKQAAKDAKDGFTVAGQRDRYKGRTCAVESAKDVSKSAVKSRRR